MASTTPLLRGFPMGRLYEPDELEEGEERGCRTPNSVSSAVKTVVDGPVGNEVWLWSERDGVGRYMGVSAHVFAVGDGVWVAVVAASSVGVMAVGPGGSWTGDTGEVTRRPYDGGFPTGPSREFVETLCRRSSGK